MSTKRKNSAAINQYKKAVKSEDKAESKSDGKKPKKSGTAQSTVDAATLQLEGVKEKRKTEERTLKAHATELEKVPTPVALPPDAGLEEEEDDGLEQELKSEMTKGTTLVRDDFTPVNSTREKLIIEYAPLIKYIAQKIAARLPANIELDDLMSSGVIGLMDAIDKYDAGRDNKFKTYAEFRIRGAILDELRAQDWVPRSVREKAKQLERAYSRLEQEMGRHATDEEVMTELGISQDEFHDLLNQVRSVALLSYDDISNFSKTDKKTLHGYGEGGGKAPTPFNEVTLASVKRVIADAILDLPEKQRLVLSLYYYEDLNLKEIGRVLDVTESRVSQLHTQAIVKLKSKLRGHMDEVGVLLT